jgi:hypothetical protein
MTQIPSTQILRICRYNPCNVEFEVPDGRGNHRVFCKTEHRVAFSKQKRVIEHKDEERNFLMSNLPGTFTTIGQVVDFIEKRLGLE